MFYAGMDKLCLAWTGLTVTYRSKYGAIASAPASLSPLLTFLAVLRPLYVLQYVPSPLLELQLFIGGLLSVFLRGNALILLVFASFSIHTVLVINFIIRFGHFSKLS